MQAVQRLFDAIFERAQNGCDDRAADEIGIRSYGS